MRAGIKIEFTDETTLTVSAVIPDFVAWERRTGRRASDLANGMTIEDLAFLAYSAATRSESDRPEFETWLETVAVLDPVDEPAPKATRRGRSNG